MFSCCCNLQRAKGVFLCDKHGLLQFAAVDFASDALCIAFCVPGGDIFLKNSIKANV
jgi:hypothetical protein